MAELQQNPDEQNPDETTTESPVVVTEEPTPPPPPTAEEPTPPAPEVPEEKPAVATRPRLTPQEFAQSPTRALELADIDRRKAAPPVKQTFGQWISNFKSDSNPEGKEFQMLGNEPIPAYIAQDMDDETRVNLFGMWSAYQPEEGEQGVVLPFETATGEFDLSASGTYPNRLRNRLKRNLKARQLIVNQLDALNLPTEVQQLVAENIILGDTQYELGQRLAEAGRFLPAVPDFFTQVLPAGIRAMYESGQLPGDPAFKAEYAALREPAVSREVLMQGLMADPDLTDEERAQKIFDWTMKRLEQSLSVRELAKNISGATLAQYYNEHIHFLLKKEYEGEEYENLAYMKNPDGTFILDSNGNKILNEFVNENTAYEMASITFDSLTPWQQAGVIVGEELIYAFSMGSLGTAAGVKTVQEANALKKSSKYKNLLKDTDDPKQVLEKVRSFESRNKADTALVNIGLIQTRTNRELRYLDNRRSAIYQELENLEKRGLRDNDIKTVNIYNSVGEVTGTGKKPVYQIRRELKAELKQIQNQRYNVILRGKFAPYTTKTTTEGLMIGIGTVIGRQSNLFSEDKDTSEAFSNIAMSLGGYKIGFATLRAGNKVLSTSRGMADTVRPIMPMLGDILGSIPVAGDILVDKTIRNYEMSIGRPLTKEEAASVRNVLTFFKKLPPEYRDQHLRAMADVEKSTKQIISRFPVEIQDEIAELVYRDYSHTAGLLSLAAAGELNRKKISLETLSKYDLDFMERDLQSFEKEYLIVSRTLDEIEQRIGNISDPGARRRTAEFVEMRRQGIVNLQKEINEVNRQQLKALDDIEVFTSTLDDSKLPDAQTMAAFRSYRKTVKRSLGEPYNELEDIANQNKQVRNKIRLSTATARGLRNTTGHGQAVDNATETYVAGRVAAIRLRGDEIYQPFKEFAADYGEVDILPVVEMLVEGQDRTTGLRRFFGPESELFLGRDGVHARQAVDNILVNQFPPGHLDAIRDNLINSGIPAEEVQKVKRMSDLEFSLYLTQHDPNFNPFVIADPYDLELLRRAFVRTAASYANSGDLENARVFGKFVDDLDLHLESNYKEYNDMAVDTRRKYELEVGTPQTKGLYIDRLQKATNRNLVRQGEGLGTTGLRSVYSKPPSEIFNDITSQAALGLSVAPNPSYRPASLQNAVQNFEYTFGDFVVDEKNPTGRYMFDLTTDEGISNFEDAQDILTEIIYEKFGKDFLKNYTESRNVYGPARINKNINPELIDKVDELESNMLVTIKTAEGQFEVPLVNLGEAIIARDTMAEAIKESPEVAKAWEVLKQDFQTYRAEQTRDIAKLTEDAQLELKLTQEILGNMTGKNFVDNYIFSSEGGSLDVLKLRFDKVAEAAGLDSAARNQMWKDITTQYTIEGLFEAGGLSPVRGKVSQVTKEGLEGAVPKTFLSPQELLAKLEEPGTRDALKKIGMDEDHISFVEDIVRHVNDSSYAIPAKNIVGDATTGYRFSSIISRAYGLARGVVSAPYVATEYLFVASRSGKIELMKLALQDKEAARILSLYANTPELLSPTDMFTFDVIAKNFLFKELGPEINELTLTGESDGLASFVTSGLETAGQALNLIGTEEEPQQ